MLEVSLPDLNGLEVQERVAAERVEMPVIFITGKGDIPMTVKAMRAGALEFMTKPFDEEELLSAVRSGLEQSHAALAQKREDSGAPHPLRITHLSRTRGHGTGGLRPVE